MQQKPKFNSRQEAIYSSDGIDYHLDTSLIKPNKGIQNISFSIPLLNHFTAVVDWLQALVPLCQGSLCKHQVLLRVYMTTDLLPFQVIVLAPRYKLLSSVTNKLQHQLDCIVTKGRFPERIELAHDVPDRLPISLFYFYVSFYAIPL